MNEEFAISLKTILDESSIGKVKERIDELTKELSDKTAKIKTVAETVKEKVTPVRRKREETLANSKEYQNVTSEIDQAQRKLNVANILGDTENIKKYEEELDRLSDKADEIRSKILFPQENVNNASQLNNEVDNTNTSLNETASTSKEVADNTKETADNMNKAGSGSKGVSSDLKKMANNAKKTLLAFIGVRGVYSGIRKAMSSYLAQNKELQNQLNACWYALGSLFAPVLESLVGVFTKIVNIVNSLVKSLGGAGINMSKFGKNASKSLASFDEINNINQGNDATAGVDFKGLQETSDLMAEIGKWVSAIALGLAGWKIASSLSNALGLTKEQCIGIGLVVAGLTLVIESILQYLNNPTWESFGGIISGIGVAIAGVGVIIGSTPVIIAGAIVAIVGLVASHWEQIKVFFENIEKTLDNLLDTVHAKITNNLGIFGLAIGTFIESAIGIVKGFVTTIKEFLDGLFTNVRKILDGIIQIFKGDFKGGISTICNGIFGLIKTLLNTIKNAVSTAFTGIKTLVKNLFEYIGNHASQKVKDIINKYIINPINKVINWLNSKLHFSYGGLEIAGIQVIPAFDVRLVNLGNIPSLDVGTNYVPNDQLAMIHQGEAIVPKEFNKDEFFNDNTDLIEKMDELISVVDTKEFRTYISQNDIGRSAVNYINRQSRIQGMSLV